MRRVIPLLLLLAIGTASATGVLNVLLGMGAAPVSACGASPLYNGTLTAASSCPSASNYGFSSGVCGSIAPTTDANGNTITLLISNTTLIQSQLFISGFSSNPGSSYFTTTMVNGISKTSSAATYAYTSGTASWTWTGEFIDATGAYPACYK